MKKIFAILMAMIMMLSMASAFAADDGSITIENSTKDATYSIYKVFDATYSGTNVAYTYSGTALLTALQADASPFTCEESSTAGVYNVAKKTSATDEQVIDWVKANASNFGAAVATVTGTGEEVVASGLAYGYYYITTSTGSTVTIDSALKDVTVVDKNEDGPTTPDKKVDNAESNTAMIGDTVSYAVTGKLARYNGTEAIKTYTFKDTMSAGLTLNQDVVVKVGEETLTAGTDYTIAYANNGFTITLTTYNDTDKTFLYAVDAEYTITYTAVVNENAVVAEDGNKNSFSLSYNNDPDTEVEDVVTTYTYQFELEKTDGTKQLTGAKFKLYNDETAGDEIILVKDAEGNYRPATATEKAADGFVAATIEVGSATIYGLENGTYWLEETEAPAGYNKLTARVEVIINNANGDKEVVVNQSGTELPSTGGIGTTIFYVVGGLLMAAAVVLLVTNKKMSAAK